MPAGDLLSRLSELRALVASSRRKLDEIATGIGSLQTEIEELRRLLKNGAAEESEDFGRSPGGPVVERHDA